MAIVIQGIPRSYDEAKRIFETGPINLRTTDAWGPFTREAASRAIAKAKTNPDRDGSPRREGSQAHLKHTPSKHTSSIRNFSTQEEADAANQRWHTHSPGNPNAKPGQFRGGPKDPDNRPVRQRRAGAAFEYIS